MLILISCSESPAPAAADPAGAGDRVTGPVVERADGAPYSFLRIRTPQGDVWVAVPIGTAAGAHELTVSRRAVLATFESRTAGRTFRQVVFGTVEAAR